MAQQFLDGCDVRSLPDELSGEAVAGPAVSSSPSPTGGERRPPVRAPRVLKARFVVSVETGNATQSRMPESGGQG